MRKLLTVGSAVLGLAGCAEGCNCSHDPIDERPELTSPATPDAGTRKPDKLDDAFGQTEPPEDFSLDAGGTGECGRPDVTRGEVAVMLADCLGVESEECAQAEPPPENPCCIESEDATEEENNAFAALCETGILQTYPDSTWQPRTEITSAEFATVVARAFGLEWIEDETDTTWYGGWYRALEKAGLLPPGESDDPSCPPSEEFVRIVSALCEKL